MGILDNFRKKATKAVDDHGDKIAKGIDKAAGAADTRTQGKYTGQLGKGQQAAKDALDRLDGRKDDIPAAQSDTPASTPHIPPAQPVPPPPPVTPPPPAP